MPFPLIPLILAGSSIVGGALSGRKGARLPAEPKEFDPLKNLLIQQRMQRLQSPTALPPGYESTGIQNINRGYGLGKESLQNLLVSRGLAGSPVEGAALERLETGRIGDIARFTNQLPLLERELGNQDFQQALDLYRSRATGYPGSAAGGAFDDLASMLG